MCPEYWWLKVLLYASRGCYSWYERYGRIVIILEDVFSMLKQNEVSSYPPSGVSSVLTNLVLVSWLASVWLVGFSFSGTDISAICARGWANRRVGTQQLSTEYRRANVGGYPGTSTAVDKIMGEDANMYGRPTLQFRIHTGKKKDTAGTMVRQHYRQYAVDDRRCAQRYTVYLLYFVYNCLCVI